MISLGKSWVSPCDSVLRGCLRAVFSAAQAALARHRAGRVESRLSAAIEALPDGFALFDAGDRLVVCNRKYREAHLNSGPALVAGARFEDIVRFGLAHGDYPEAEGCEQAWLAEWLRGHRSPEGAFERRLPDGRWMLIAERRTRDGGTACSVVDITALKTREFALGQAAAAAECASRAKGDFVSSVSHELRTPLNAIIGFSELIEREVYGPSGHPNYRQYAVDIHRSGQHLLSLINDLLDLSKIESGKLDLNEEPVEVPHAAASAIRIIRDRARVAGLDLRCEIDAGLPLLRGDERALRQILLNLLSNAIKFTGTGGFVTLRARPVPGGGIALAVEDCGIGMAPDGIRVAMEPFGQIAGPMASRHDGTGLGLPIAKKLTEAMGGSIAVASRPGVGTVVTLRFPPARLIASGAAAMLDA